MVKSTYVAFPQEGVELLVSAKDALANGINPGDPAVVEVIVREHTVEEWIAEASGSAFETEEEGGDSSESGSDPIATGVVEDHPIIRWESVAEPMPSTGGEEPAVIPIGMAEDDPKIRWRSVAAEPMPSTAGEEPTVIRWEPGHPAG